MSLFSRRKDDVRPRLVTIEASLQRVERLLGTTLLRLSEVQTALDDLDVTGEGDAARQLREEIKHFRWALEDLKNAQPQGALA